MLSDEKVIPICRFWANKLWKRGQDFDELVSVAYCNLKTLDEKTDTKLLHGWAKFSIIQHITNKSIVSLPHITVEAKQEKLQNFVENYPLVLKELKKEKTDQDQIADLREAFKILNTDELDLIYLYFWRGWTYRKISKEFEKSIFWVRKHIKQALLKIKKEMLK